MTAPRDYEKPLDFEELSFEELGRAPVCETGMDAVGPTETRDLMLPLRRRCDSHQRELLGNHFPTE